MGEAAGEAHVDDRERFRLFDALLLVTGCGAAMAFERVLFREEWANAAQRSPVLLFFFGYRGIVLGLATGGSMALWLRGFERGLSAGEVMLPLNVAGLGLMSVLVSVVNQINDVVGMMFAFLILSYACGFVVVVSMERLIRPQPRRWTHQLGVIVSWMIIAGWFLTCCMVPLAVDTV